MESPGKFYSPQNTAGVSQEKDTAVISRTTEMNADQVPNILKNHNKTIKCPHTACPKYSECQHATTWHHVFSLTVHCSLQLLMWEPRSRMSAHTHTHTMQRQWCFQNKLACQRFKILGFLLMNRHFIILLCFFFLRLKLGHRLIQLFGRWLQCDESDFGAPVWLSFRKLVNLFHNMLNKSFH